MKNFLSYEDVTLTTKSWHNPSDEHHDQKHPKIQVWCFRRRCVWMLEQIRYLLKSWKERIYNDVLNGWRSHQMFFLGILRLKLELMEDLNLLELEICPWNARNTNVRHPRQVHDLKYHLSKSAQFVKNQQTFWWSSRKRYITNKNCKLLYGYWGR